MASRGKRVILALSSQQISQIVQGEHLGESIEITRIVRDNREVVSHSLFVALKGHRLDGHDFVPQLIPELVAVLVERECDFAGTQIVVRNTRLAMAKIAAYLCKQFKGKKLALTGSCGKTTSKEMLLHALATQANCYGTPGNYNNDIGVPLTVFAMPALTDVAVFELGANAIGEIDYTSAIVQPDVALLLNAKGAHIEGFGSLENIRIAKGEIYKHVTSDGVCVVNLDDAGAGQWLHAISGRVLTVSLNNTDADVFATDVQLGQSKTTATVMIAGQSYALELQVIGEHMLANTLAVLAVILAAGFDVAEAIKQLASFQAVKGRQQRVVGLQQAQLVDDSYNANPDSVKAAIDALTQQAGKRILVLGHMAELGPDASQMHLEIGAYAKGKVDEFHVTGAYAEAYKQGFGAQTHCYGSAHDIAEYLKTTITKDSIIWVKGSRSAKMEIVVDALRLSENS